MKKLIFIFFSFLTFSCNKDPNNCNIGKVRKDKISVINKKKINLEVLINLLSCDHFEFKNWCKKNNFKNSSDLPDNTFVNDENEIIEKAFFIQYTNNDTITIRNLLIECIKLDYKLFEVSSSEEEVKINKNSKIELVLPEYYSETYTNSMYRITFSCKKKGDNFINILIAKRKI